MGIAEDTASEPAGPGRARVLLARWRRSLPWLALLGLFVVAATGVIVHLWSGPGWPHNHEGADFAIRTEIASAHLQQGHVLPVWSNLDNEGFGSPQPALYHKLFYLVSGSLRAAGLSLKGALATSVVAFLVVGAAGMVRLLRELGAPSTVAAISGLLLMAANYTTTNWLVRGALAELSAAMLVPWVLWGLLVTARRGRVSLALPIGLGLCFWAHSVMGLYLTGLTGVALLLGLAAGRVERSLITLRQVVVLAGTMLVVAGPVLVVTLLMGRGYDVSRIVPPAFHPTAHFQSPLSYLVDTSWRWGRTPAGLSVQLDLPLTALLVAGVALRLRHHRTTIRAEPPIPGVWILGMVFLMAGLLQLRLVAPFYRHVPTAEFLQFPWRLLAVLTPALIALALVIPFRGAPERTARAGAALALAGVLLLGGAVTPLSYGRTALDDLGDTVTLGYFGEYTPVDHPTLTVPPAAAFGRPTPGGCEVTHRNEVREARPVTFDVSCPREQLVSLPVFLHRSHRVEVGPTTGRCAPAPPPDQALCSVVVPPGEHTVTVRPVTLARLLADLFP